LSPSLATNRLFSFVINTALCHVLCQPTTIINVTKNEILYSLNKPEAFILAIAEFLPGDDSRRVHYVRKPFQREPDFGVTSVNYDFAELLARASTPS
jgi:hypothetical protein